MPVKIENNRISLAVRDLLQPGNSSAQMLSSFPLPQRGVLGKQAQFKTQQQKQRSFGFFHREFPVSGQFNIGEYEITITGRADGVYEVEDRLEVEEIKSVVLTVVDFKKLDIKHFPHYSEQVLFYCYLLQKENPRRKISAFLTLVNLVNDKIRHFPVKFDFIQVEKLLTSRLQELVDQAGQQQRETLSRCAELDKIEWPLREQRPQQQEMMRQVRETIESGGHLLVSAPTGTGKTAAALIPAVEYAIQKRKKIFFATAKNTQQQIVLETLLPLIESEMNFKVLLMRSSAKMCANDIFFCHEDFCPYAKNYRERLLETNILGKLDSNFVSADEIFEKAKGHLLCPAEVLLDLTPYADVVVGDYNYVFDPAVFLRRLFNRSDLSGWILVIDEAHNLLQRGSNYFSPALKNTHTQTLLKLHRAKRSPVYKNLLEPLKALQQLFNSLQQEGESSHSGQRYFTTTLNVPELQDIFNRYEAAFIKYLIHRIKRKMVFSDDPLEEMYFTLRRFLQVARIGGPEFIPFFDAAESGILSIQCCDPAAQLGVKIDSFHSVIAMSATLDPMRYYQDTLGFPPDRTELLYLDSPFPPGNRKMIIVPGVSTKFSQRSKNYPRYAEIIEKVIEGRRGNYIAFFPSFEFMQNTNLFLGKIRSEKILQRISMTEQDRDEVLYRLRDTSRPQLLLAVMGGIFSEGVDFRGDMCIGVIIFSPALPQVNYERELIREYFDRKSDNGFEYAYLYPGMNKVIQSAGRLIRSAQDRGVIVLAGERFADDAVNRLLPAYWFKNPGDVVITDEYESEIKSFWSRFSGQ